MNIHFHKATVKDSQKIADIHVSSWKFAYQKIIPDAILAKITVSQKEEYFRHVLAKKKEDIFCIKKGRDIVGFLVLGLSRDEDLDDSYGEIWSIYLYPHLWNQGIGSIAIRYSFDMLKIKGYKKCSLWVLKDNVTAIFFYKKHGFSFLSTKAIFLGGKKLIENRYTKIL